MTLLKLYDSYDIDGEPIMINRFILGGPWALGISNQNRWEYQREFQKQL